MKLKKCAIIMYDEEFRPYKIIGYTDGQFVYTKNGKRIYKDFLIKFDEERGYYLAREQP